MKLGIIVTEFPKTTETFILRDLLNFHQQGHEVRIYHLAPYRGKEIVHEFARPALAWAQPAVPFIGWRSLKALGRALLCRPTKLLGILAEIVTGCRGNLVLLGKSLAILPKSLAFAEDLVSWQVDHVHAEFAGHPCTSAWIIGRMTGLPYSVSCRAHDIFRTQAMLGTKLPEATFVRTISEFNRRFLLERIDALDASKVTVIHSSVDVARIPRLPAPANGKFRVLYVGSLQIRKGVDVLLKALSDIPALGDWSCDIIGGGPEAEQLQRLAATLGLGDRVRFLGPQAFEIVTGAYANANVIVVPSIVGPKGRTEGIPNVVIEALAHQRPVVATRVSGVPELVSDGATGRLVAPGDVQELRTALCWIRDNPEAAYAMAQRGREQIEKEFDLVKSARAQLEKFHEHRVHRPAESLA